MRNIIPIPSRVEIANSMYSEAHREALKALCKACDAANRTCTISDGAHRRAYDAANDIYRKAILAAKKAYSQP